MHILFMILGVILVFIINPLIAFFNAKTVGNVWANMYSASTWEKSVCISALVQSIVGFSMPSLGILLFLGYFFHILTNNQIFIGIDLFWVSVIIPIIGTGLIITIDSIKTAIKEKSFSSGMVALWNVGATIENIIDFITNFGSVITDITKRSDDEDDSSNMVIVGVVVIAMLMGCLWTALSFNYGRKQTQYSY